MGCLLGVWRKIHWHQISSKFEHEMLKFARFQTKINRNQEICNFLISGRFLSNFSEICSGKKSILLVLQCKMHFSWNPRNPSIWDKNCPKWAIFCRFRGISIDGWSTRKIRQIYPSRGKFVDSRCQINTSTSRWRCLHFVRTTYDVSALFVRPPYEGIYAQPKGWAITFNKHTVRWTVCLFVRCLFVRRTNTPSVCLLLVQQHTYVRTYNVRSYVLHFVRTKCTSVRWAYLPLSSAEGWAIGLRTYFAQKCCAYDVRCALSVDQIKYCSAFGWANTNNNRLVCFTHQPIDVHSQ